MGDEPFVSPRAAERLLKHRVMRSGDVQRSPRVMFTETGSGIESQDGFDRITFRDLPAEDLGLSGDAAKPRNRQKYNCFALCCFIHLFPSRSSRSNELN